MISIKFIVNPSLPVCLQMCRPRLFVRRFRAVGQACRIASNASHTTTPGATAPASPERCRRSATARPGPGPLAALAAGG